MTSYLLSWLRKQHAGSDLETFLRERPHDWIVWEAGRWRPPSQTGETVVAQPTGSASDSGESLAIAAQRSRGRDVLSIGRAPENDVVLDDATLSRVHLVLMRDAHSRWTIRDGGSSNGTWVDRHRLEPGKPVPLESRAQIKAGAVRLTFYEGKDFYYRLKGMP